MILRLAILVLIPLLFANGINASEKETVATQTPFMNPWDANQWEPGSDHSFWHSEAGTGAGRPKDAAKPKTPAKPVPSAVEAPAKPDFSDRQTEK